MSSNRRAEYSLARRNSSINPFVNDDHNMIYHKL